MARTHRARLDQLVKLLEPLRCSREIDLREPAVHESARVVVRRAAHSPRLKPSDEHDRRPDVFEIRRYRAPDVRDPPEYRDAKHRRNLDHRTVLWAVRAGKGILP